MNSRSYNDKMREKLKHDSLFNVEEWYTYISSHTFLTKFYPLSISQARIIRKIYRNEKLAELDITIIKDFSNQLQKFIETNFSNKDLFIRLSTRSPKDCSLDFENPLKQKEYREKIKDKLFSLNVNSKILSQRLNSNQNKLNILNYAHLLLNENELNEILIFILNISKNSLKVKNSEEIINLLQSSERVSVDIVQLLAAKNILDQKSENEDELLCNIILREWRDINDEDEFRCFFYNSKLTAISQYNHYIYDEELVLNQNKIKNIILDHFEKISGDLPMKNGVIDYVVFNKKIPFIIELNPFNDYVDAGTGGALFCWKNDIEILKNGPCTIRVVEKIFPEIKEKLDLFGLENLIRDSVIDILEESKRKCIIF